MMDVIKQYGRLFVLTFLIGALLPSGLEGYVQANITDGNPYNISNATSEELLVAFHTNANDIVNKKLEMLISGEDIVTDYVSAGECAENNVSTFCLGVELSTQLMYLEEVIQETREDIVFEAEDGTLSLDEGIEKFTQTRSNVDEEIQVIEDSIELTLSVYNQVMLVYPLHEELVDLINNLMEYRDALATLRGVVEAYPSKFHDATMVKCQ